MGHCVVQLFDLYYCLQYIVVECSEEARSETEERTGLNPSLEVGSASRGIFLVSKSPPAPSVSGGLLSST
jgi:hypothetical protein